MTTNSLVGARVKNFEIKKEIGKGGMGVVYLARDIRLNRSVAIKALPSPIAGSQERQARFLQEARSAAAVTHPSIAQIYEADKYKGITFIAMEFIEGKTISCLIAKKEIDLIGAVEIALHVAEGLSQAHKRNIVHRDVKSSNIMLTKDGQAKILDFGLAKPVKIHKPITEDESDHDLTRTETFPETKAGTVVGTVSYMSPEQARGKPVEPSGDVFSLGIVLYEMVTGELPFKGDSPVDTMHVIAFDEVHPVTMVRKNVPPEINRIIMKCLRKRLEDRYSDADELAKDLRRLKREIETRTQSSLIESPSSLKSLLSE